MIESSDESMLNCVHSKTQLRNNSQVLEKIGVREFRSNLAKYINASNPVAVMRHGHTVGYFIPASIEPELAEIEALKLAANKLDELLASRGVSEEELVQEFRQLRENQE